MTIMKTGTPPSNQKELPIALVMFSNAGLWEHYLTPRPEEITYTHPTRATVVQTLGGAWVDDFGEGLVDISISGTTGWRSTQHLESAEPNMDGKERMFDLRHYFFEVFHQERMAAAQNGQNPDDVVQLFLMDTLNQIGFLVYPVSMQARKHKSRPLLYQYQLRLMGLQKVNQDTDSINGYAMESIA